MITEHTANHPEVEAFVAGAEATGLIVIGSDVRGVDTPDPVTAESAVSLPGKDVTGIDVLVTCKTSCEGVVDVIVVLPASCRESSLFWLYVAVS